MRRSWLLIWFCGLAGFSLGCGHNAKEELPYFTSKISFADKFYDIEALDAERAVIVGYAGKILTTEDGGQSWQLRNSGTRKALYSVEFVNSERGWIAGQEGTILTTRDGGKTWTPQSAGINLYLFAVDFVDEREGWIAGERATYLHTTDGGRTWRVAKFGANVHLTEEEALMAQDPNLYDVHFVDSETGWIVGEFGKIYHTWNGGRSWVEQQESLLGTAGIFDPLDIPTFFGVSFINPMNGIVTGLQGRVARTHDGGQTWRFEKFDVEVPLSDPLFAPFQFPDTTAWAVGAAGEVVQQLTPGGPWRRADMGMEILTWMREIKFADKNNGWIVGGRGHILHTTDGGATWTPSMG